MASNRSRRALDVPPRTLLSYGIYLLHMAMIGLVTLAVNGNKPSFSNRLDDVVIVVIAFAATVGLARLSWIHFEKPILDLSAA